MLRHDRVGSKLDEGHGDPLALDPAGSDRVTPDVEDGDGLDIGQVAHGSSSGFDGSVTTWRQLTVVPAS
jgi:hypothetical protein